MIPHDKAAKIEHILKLALELDEKTRDYKLARSIWEKAMTDVDAHIDSPADIFDPLLAAERKAEAAMDTAAELMSDCKWFFYTACDDLRSERM